ncbi:hypothetical protein LSTR_LSTR014708 [Laodelphax striatellus]|uniref:Reverse transcriptase domain-containing protein n=1 Tax=Laodelphax striatellus TaxID=195883 RepID=A0A482X0A1_LAOST|nr:hypothetical protein LSTR_LSTR014708 [Laodelphax striatellus]
MGTSRFSLRLRVCSALSDLNKAIELSQGGSGRSGSQALCQRALIMLKLQKRPEAIADLTAAARNGNHFAKSQIVHRRIYTLCEEQLTSTQFGFRNAVGTREALFGIQVLFQRCRDVNCDVYACFIDYQKAFDRVQHQKLADILRNIGLDDKDIRIIVNLYWNQTATMRLDIGETEELEIVRGVRQGCLLSPLLFNVYSEHILREALDERDEGILINGERINNIRYADDTVIFTDSMHSLRTS